MSKTNLLKMLCLIAAVTIYACSTPIKAPDTENNILIKQDTLTANLSEVSKFTLKALHKADVSNIAALIHPEKGLLLSPYGHVNIETTRHFTAAGFIEEANINKVSFWGIYDGTGDSILLDWKGYSKKFVYDKDFLKADSFLLNTISKRGNTLNNIRDIFPEAEFSESYVKGSPQYSEMDWASLYLVFEKIDDKYYLVAIIHDQWTV